MSVPLGNWCNMADVGLLFKYFRLELGLEIITDTGLNLKFGSLFKREIFLLWFQTPTSNQYSNTYIS